MAMVSVIVAAFDAEATIAASIESVLRQTYDDFELLIVDDGSRDNTASIVTEYHLRDPRVRLVAHGRHVGRSAARNLAMNAATGLFIAVLDADDEMVPERLTLQMDFLKAHPQISILGGAALLRDQAGNALRVQRMPTDHHAALASLTRTSPFVHSTVMLRRSVLELLGGYETRYEPCEDFELWIRASQRFEFANVNDVLAQYTVRRTVSWRSLYWTCRLVYRAGSLTQRRGPALIGVLANIAKFVKSYGASLIHVATASSGSISSRPLRPGQGPDQ